MNATVDALNPTRVKLTVEVPFEELKPVMDSAYRRIARQVRVPGFRPGKAPAAILDRYVGRAAVLEEALNDAVPRFYGEAVESRQVATIGQPSIEVQSFGDGTPLVFTAEVDVRPDIELPAYDGLPVTVEAVTVTDADVESRVESLLDQFAVLEGVDRAVELGDYVLIDIKAAGTDGTPIPGSEATGLSYEVGSDTLVPGLDRTLVGMSAGETKTFDAEIKWGELAGTDATFEVTVTSVKVKDVPPLDDEFAARASEFGTLDELRADIRARLERVLRLEQGVEARDKTLDAYLDRIDVPLPVSMVEAETEWRRGQAEQQIEAAGMSVEEYLAQTGQEMADFEADARKTAERAVKAQLVLDALAVKEELAVSEAELTDQLVRRAVRAGMKPDDYAQRLVQRGQLRILMGEILRGKALAAIMEAAEITDSNGAPVDLASLNDNGALTATAAEAEFDDEDLDDVEHDHDHDHEHDHAH